jgi:hypothetical protein
MKNLFIIVFHRIDNQKAEEKNVYKTFVVMLLVSIAFEHHVMLFASATFGYHVVLFTFATFGHSSCGWLHSKFSKLEEKKR